MDKMKAVVYNKKASPEKLIYCDIDKPVPKDNEVLIKPNRVDLEFLTKLLENGKIKPIIDRRYPLDKTSDAMNYISQGHSTGKVVINI